MLERILSLTEIRWCLAKFPPLLRPQALRERVQSNPLQAVGSLTPQLETMWMQVWGHQTKKKQERIGQPWWTKIIFCLTQKFWLTRFDDQKNPSKCSISCRVIIIFSPGDSSSCSYCHGYFSEVYDQRKWSQVLERTIKNNSLCGLYLRKTFFLRILYEYLAEASIVFPKVFSVIHSLLDAKITNVLSLCHDKTILAAVQVRPCQTWPHLAHLTMYNGMTDRF